MPTIWHKRTPAMNGKKIPSVDNRIFWENKALTYPLPFEKKTFFQTNRIIGLMEKRGVSIEGSRILDIGCGPGTFALPLALRGASVTALDISHNMLRRLSGGERQMGLKIPGVETVRASWKHIDPVKAGLSGRFDIVLSALSIAVETEKGIRKMEQCSRQWCVCIAAGKIRHRSVCRTILQMFGAPLDPRPDIRVIRDMVERMGRTYSYTSFPVITREIKTISELAEDVAKRLEAQGRKADRHRILSGISSLFTRLGKSDTVECTHDGDRGILMWKGGTDRLDDASTVR